MRTNVLASLLFGAAFSSLPCYAEEPPSQSHSPAPAATSFGSTGPESLPSAPPGRSMAAAGAVLGGVGTGMLAVGFAGIGLGSACSGQHGGCPENRGTGFVTIAASGFAIGTLLWAVGGPLLGVGTSRTRTYKNMLIERDLDRERTAMIASGIFFGLGAGLSIASGVALAAGSYAPQSSQQMTTQGLSIFGAVVAGSALVPLLWSAGNYSSYKSALRGDPTRRSMALLSSVSVSPIVSSNLCGLTLSGRWN